MPTASFTTSETTTRTREVTYDLASFRSLASVSVNTGNVSVVSTNGTQVTLQLSSGSVSKKIQTGGSYLASDTKYVTSQLSSFYDSGGYSGSLSSYLYSGSYTSADTKYVTAQLSSSYNQDGYTGTLGQYVYSSTPSSTESKEISSYYAYTQEEYDERKAAGNMWIESMPYSDSNGFSGTLYKWSEPVYVSPERGYTQPMKGTVYKTIPASNTYRYQGNVSRPESDTRTYRYQGYVTKPGYDTRTYDYYYQYAVTFDYIKNNLPTVDIKDGLNLGIADSSVKSWRSKSNFSFKMNFDDLDSVDTVQYSVLVNGVEKVAWTEVSKSTEIQYAIPPAELALGSNSIKILTKDSFGEQAEKGFTLRNLFPRSLSNKHSYDLLLAVSAGSTNFGSLQSLKPTGYGKATLSIAEIIDYLS